MSFAPRLFPLNSRRLAVWLAWLALFATLGHAALPAFAYAGSARHGRLVEVCTASGTRSVLIQDGTAAPAHGAEHCAFCLFDASPPLSAGVAQVDATAARHPVVPVLALVARGRGAAFLPPARAPPVFPFLP